MVANRNYSCDNPFVDARDFRDQMRSLVRALGLLDDSRTPCGVDISVREAFALGTLLRADLGSAPSQSDLQESLNIDKSNVTRLVQRLTSNGWVEQRPGSDGRVRTLHLTAKGRRLAGRLEESSVRRFQGVLAKIPSAERDAVLRAVEVLRVALECSTAGQRDE